MKEPDANRRDDAEEFEGPLYPGLEGLADEPAKAEATTAPEKTSVTERPAPVATESQPGPETGSIDRLNEHNNSQRRNRLLLFMGVTLLIVFWLTVLKSFFASHSFPFAQAVGAILLTSLFVVIRFTFVRSYFRTSWGVYGLFLIVSLMLWAAENTAKTADMQRFVEYAQNHPDLSEEELRNSGVAWAYGYSFYGHFMASASVLIWGFVCLVSYASYKGALRKGVDPDSYVGKRYYKDPHKSKSSFPFQSVLHAQSDKPEKGP
jgi:hypothetical protein